MMDLHYYPLDIQNCTVEIESCKCDTNSMNRYTVEISYKPKSNLPVDGYPMEDVEMRWRVGKKSVIGVDNVDLPQFSLVDYDTIATIQVLASGMSTALTYYTCCVYDIEYV